MIAQEFELAERQQRLAVIKDHPRGERELAIGAPPRQKLDPAGAAAEIDVAQQRIIGVVDGHVFVALVGEDAQLRGQVGIEVWVSIKVVGGEVQKDPALGRECNAVFELKA